jgi:hypothetical protein
MQNKLYNLLKETGIFQSVLQHATGYTAWVRFPAGTDFCVHLQALI